MSPEMKRKIKDKTLVPEISVCMGFDALRLAMGQPMQHFTVGEVKQWLASLENPHSSPFTCDVCDKHPCVCTFGDTL